MNGSLRTDIGFALSSCVQHSERPGRVHRADLTRGDHLYIITANSRYHVHAAGDGVYLASGGWFDRTGITPFRTTITGCTWGGSVINTTILAAIGLSVEFGNRVTTSPIRKIILLRHALQN